MKKKRVWRYYCDHCGKGGCGGAAMAKHEQRCTMNPNRECGFHCDEDYIIDPPVLDDLKEIIKASKVFTAYANPVNDMVSVNLEDDEALRKELLDAAGGCPACTLAAIRQTGINLESFKYKDEVKRVFAEWRDAQDESAQYDAMYD